MDLPGAWDGNGESQSSAVSAEVTGAECLKALASSNNGESPPRLMRRLGVKLAFLEGQSRVSRESVDYRTGTSVGCLFADGFSLHYSAAAEALVEEICERRAQRFPLSTEKVLDVAKEDKEEISQLLGALLLRGVLYLEMG